MFQIVPFTFMVLLCTINSFIDGASVMSVDLGTEYMKVAIVMPGIPMEVVPDGDSKRKTTTTIGFREDRRLFGNEAATLAVRQPEMAFERVPALLGKRPGHSTFELYRQWYPYHNITFDEMTGQVVLHHPTGVQYTAEELVGMLFEHAKGNAERYIMADVHSSVITVPSYYGQAERRSLLRAANLGGLEVLQLINDNTAVALNFGIFRRSLFNAKAQNFLFFDVGSMSTTATVASYYVGKHRERGTTAEDPILTVLGVASVPRLGTTFMIRRLADHLATQFVAKKKDQASAREIFNNTRSMAKFRVEANRVLNQLSANMEVYAQAERVFNDEDFRMKVTRKEHEELCADLFRDLHNPFQEALALAKMSTDDISELVLMGGGTRIPKIQEHLRMLFGRDLNRGVNGDDAAVLGAVYQGAAQTAGFKVLPFVVRDYNQYPIAVDFAPAPPGQSGAVDKQEPSEESSPFIRRILFPRANMFPQKRSITFSRHMTDLDFSLNYVNLQVAEQEYLLTTNLSLVETDGVTQAIAKTPNAEARGVKAHFSMDAGGLLTLTRVECLFQAIEKPESESTLTKLGNTIGDFLGVGKTSGEAGDADGASATSGEQKEAPSPDDPKAAAGSEDKSKEQMNQTVNATTTKGPITYSKLVNFTLVHLDLGTPSESDVQVSKAKLDHLRVVALDQQYLDSVVNEVEKAIITVPSLLESSDFNEYSTESERQRLSDVVSKVSDWYDEQTHRTPREDYESKLSDINSLLLPMKTRHSEAKKRPGAIAVLETAVRDSLGMVGKMRRMNEVIERMLAEMLAAASLNANATAGDSQAGGEAALDATESAAPPAGSTASGEGDAKKVTGAKPPVSVPSWATVFTETEITEFEASVNKVAEWLEESRAQLQATPLTERPPVLAEEFIEKKQQLTRVVLPYHRRLTRWQSEMETHKKAVEAAAASSKQTSETQQTVENMPDNFNNVDIRFPGDIDVTITPKKEDDKANKSPREDL